MPSREELKRRAFEEIDARADEIVSLAKTILQNPEPGFRETKTSALAANKLAEAGCTNGAVVLFHAGYLARLFAPGELDAIHVNHPDPWPKKRHARNRMIAPAFVTAVTGLLAPGGVLEVKSDRAEYADELRRCADDLPLAIEAFTPDLHRPGEPLAADNILTNYERKFIARGEPVFLMRLRRR